MCELLGMSSSRPATVDFSLMKFAERGGRAGPHKDGWGIGYYMGKDVDLIKEAQAAADSDWVRFLVEHSIESPTVIAHVRLARIGNRSYANSQPFSRELGGRRHLFAHNGNLPGIFELDAFRSDRFHAIGDTDSEFAFCSLLHRLSALWKDPDQPPSEQNRIEIVTQFASEVRELGPANFLYSDGELLIAHGHRRLQPDSGEIRPPGLVRLHRECGPDTEAFASDGLSIASTHQQITLFASVPLTDEDWVPLDEGEVVVVCKGHQQSLRVQERLQPR